MIDADTATAVGGSGTILRTIDGGATWTPQASGTTNLLWGVAFVDANVGWVSGFSGTILHTTDGGATWTNEPSGTTNQLVGVALSGGGATAVGGIGTILRAGGGTAGDTVFTDGFDG